MARTDTEIHNIELLLTLDYLIHNTDEKHPATQLDICRYAPKYGLKYSEVEPSGNEVRRQRIGECLKFLKRVTDKFPLSSSFSVKTTKGNKYYLERNNLNEEQIIKILAAVKNDKYTQDEDTNLLINRLLDGLSNNFKRQYFLNEVDKASKGVRKYNNAINRRIRLVTKAFNEQKLLKLRWDIYGKTKEDKHTYDFWYRVYQIREYRSKPYAVLIPVDTGDLIFFKGFVFDAIENLYIPNLPDNEVLISDPEEHRDLDKLFKQKAKWINKYYDSPEEMLKQNIIPINGVSFKIGFYFKKVVLKFIQPSFEQYFSTPLKGDICASFDIRDDEEVSRKNDNEFIIPHKLKEGETAEYCVVNTTLDPEAFIAWLITDVHGDGRVHISDMVKVVGPYHVKHALARIYEDHFLKHLDSLNSGDLEKVKEKLKNL